MPTDIYISVDVETDGPIPGLYSMLSFGAVIAGTFDGAAFQRATAEETFYRELKPISDDFLPEALAVSGLNRDSLASDGTKPEVAMREFTAWIAEVAGTHHPVLVAFPLSFDWMWFYWYFMRFTQASPFKHSRCLDIKTAYAVKAGIPVTQAGLGSLPTHLRSKHPHTHNALDDARQQADIFANVFEWSGPNQR